MLSFLSLGSYYIFSRSHLDSSSPSTPTTPTNMVPVIVPNTNVSRNRKALDLRDPRTGQAIDLHRPSDQTDSTPAKLRPPGALITRALMDLTLEAGPGSTKAGVKSAAIKSSAAKVTTTVTTVPKKDVGNEAYEAFNGVPPTLEIGSSHRVTYGFAEDTGRIVLVLGNKATDHCIETWTEYYLTHNLDHLKIRENLQNRMVMIVDGTNSTVTRGRLLSDDGGAGTVYCVDDGKVATVPSSQLYLTTKNAIKAQWKNVLVELDGLGFFLNTEMMARAIPRAEVYLQSAPLKINVKGQSKDKVPLVTINIKGEAKTFNEILLQECFKESSLQLPEKGVCLGEVVNVEEDGLICFHLVTGMKSSPGETMDSFLADYTIENLTQAHPPVTAENVSPNEVYVAVFEDDDYLYRAKVLKNFPETNSASVEFLDYGNMAVVPYEKMCLAKYLDPTLPLIPSLMAKAYLKWIQRFKDYDSINDEITHSIWEILVRHEYRDGLPVVCLQDETKENWNQTILKAGRAIKMKHN